MPPNWFTPRALGGVAPAAADTKVRRVKKVWKGTFVPMVLQDDRPVQLAERDMGRAYQLPYDDPPKRY
jgi:hypothetical protein